MLDHARRPTPRYFLEADAPQFTGFNPEHFHGNWVIKETRSRSIGHGAVATLGERLGRGLRHSLLAEGLFSDEGPSNDAVPSKRGRSDAAWCGSALTRLECGASPINPPSIAPACSIWDPGEPDGEHVGATG